PQDLKNLTGLVAYYFRGKLAMAGEFDHLGTPGAVGQDWDAEQGGTGRMAHFDTDLTKSPSDDPNSRITEERLPFLEEGAPIRKTDKAGPGTKGTRAVEGIKGRFWLAFR